MTLSYYRYDETRALAVFNGRRSQLVESFALDAVLELYAAIP